MDKSEIAEAILNGHDPREMLEQGRMPGPGDLGGPPEPGPGLNEDDVFLFAEGIAEELKESKPRWVNRFTVENISAGAESTRDPRTDGEKASFDIEFLLKTDNNDLNGIMVAEPFMAIWADEFRILDRDAELRVELYNGSDQVGELTVTMETGGDDVLERDFENRLWNQIGQELGR